jgi:hypothetical protein
MAKFHGFDAQQMLVVQRIYRDCRRVLETIVLGPPKSRFGTDAFRQVFGQIMGGGTSSVVKQAEKDLEETIKVMHARIAGQSFDVTYEPTFGNTNADMLSVSHTVSGGGSAHTSFVDEARQEGAVAARLPMRLGPNFFTMQDRELFGQSKIETFLHELSHHSAGTIDDEDGGECYDWDGVCRLKGLGPARAVRNAENVGFFCVWLG